MRIVMCEHIVADQPAGGLPKVTSFHECEERWIRECLLVTLLELGE